jgi:hypothetical protein
MIVDIFFVEPSDEDFANLHGLGARRVASRLLMEFSYTAVARFDLEDFDLAFRATNHIEEDWRDAGKKNNTLLWAAKGDVRSSMVGDIYLTEKGAYLVESVGFHLMDDEVLPCLKNIWERRTS